MFVCDANIKHLVIYLYLPLDLSLSQYIYIYIYIYIYMYTHTHAHTYAFYSGAKGCIYGMQQFRNVFERLRTRCEAKRARFNAYSSNSGEVWAGCEMVANPTAQFLCTFTLAQRSQEVCNNDTNPSACAFTLQTRMHE